MNGITEDAADMCFNSTLVRLEEVPYFDLLFPPLCFNSSMVRLEGEHAKALGYKYHVSIPVWFDWKATEAGLSYLSYTCFNSSMVRLEAGISSH